MVRSASHQRYDPVAVVRICGTRRLNVLKRSDDSDGNSSGVEEFEVHD
jgi:hypothetical protein